jgi:membrane-associated phospholipid phosphatase
MTNIDDVVYSKRLRKVTGELEVFSENAKFIYLSNPPLNSSLSTGKEMLFLQGVTISRTKEMEKSIRKHDKDPLYAIKMYMKLFGLQYDAEYMKRILVDTAFLVRKLKNKFNRPRPSQLSPYYMSELEVISSRSAKTPSYPSGHTTQARLIAEIYADKYPEHRKNLLMAAEEAGAGRIIGGLHFPTDHKAGIYLAKRLFKTIKNKKPHKSSADTRIFDISSRKGD